MKTRSAPIERPAEFFLESESARITVRLKHDEHTFPMTGAGGCNRGGDLGGMVPVIIDHQVARRFIANLKSTSCAAESLERGDDVVEREARFREQGRSRQEH